MHDRFAAASVIGMVAVVVISATVFSACTTASEAPQDAQDAQDVPRMADGRPDFTGVWAGPGFVHTGEEFDKPTVRRFTEEQMSPVKPEAQALLYRAHTGNVRIDDPTGICLPNGLTCLATRCRISRSVWRRHHSADPSVLLPNGSPMTIHVISYTLRACSNRLASCCNKSPACSSCL